MSYDRYMGLVKVSMSRLEIQPCDAQRALELAISDGDLHSLH